MKVPRRSLFALAAGFFFPGFRSDPDPAPPPPDLRLTKKPDDLYPPSAFYINGRLIPEYICPIHGDIGTAALYLRVPAQGGEYVDETFCWSCVFDQLQKLPIARLGDD